MFKAPSSRSLVRLAALAAVALGIAATLHAQGQSGTVKTIEAANITVTTTAGADVTIPVAPDAFVLQLAPGVTDLKTAQPVKLTDINPGDKVIVGKKGETTASRVIVIKASDIAARNQAEQADWQKRGAGGIVKSVDGNTLTISSGSRTVAVQTSSTTVFRRYASDSIKFQDARPGSLAEVHAGDQLSVRGDKSPDGASIKADEVVTGTFANLSGALDSVDAAAGTITMKDLTTKKMVVVHVTANSDLRKLPPQMAAAFAARNNPAGAGAAPAGGPPAGARPADASGAPGGAGAGRARAGMDLSRMLARLPSETVADLHKADAVMVVASPGATPESFTAITLLSGVEQLLSAPAGQQPITLSPWNIGAPEGGGGSQ